MMITLGSVINAFTSGFSYLDKQTKKRQTQWYEIWYSERFVERNYTNRALTAGIEKIVIENERYLANLNTNHGINDFEAHKAAFCTMIATLLHKVQVERFTHSTLETNNYHDDTFSTLERNLYPKKSGFFEKQLIKGLQSVEKEFPDLQELMETMITKIKGAVLKPVLVFQEEARRNGRNRMFSENNCSAMGSEYHTTNARQTYAEKNIKTLQF